ncbi:MAG: hypothetical protein ABI947_29500 [Chloroflexota bacterium]
MLDEIHLRELDDILAQLDQPRHYEVTAADSTALRCNDVETLVRQTIPTRSLIKEIEVTTPISERPNARLVLRKATDQDTIYYALNGSETEVPYLSVRLNEWIATLEPWYARWTRFNILFALSAVLLTLALALVCVIGGLYVWSLSRGISVAWAKPIDPTLTLYVTGITLVILIGMAVVLGALRARLLPSTTFAIGYGLQRHKRVVQLRRAGSAIFAIGFALLCGIIVNWILGVR